MGAPQPESAPPPTGMPPVLHGGNVGPSSSEIDGVPPRYVYMHTPVPNT